MIKLINLLKESIGLSDIESFTVLNKPLKVRQQIESLSFKDIADCISIYDYKINEVYKYY